MAQLFTVGRKSINAAGQKKSANFESGLVSRGEALPEKGPLYVREAFFTARGFS
jgi:hypothetical protein